MGGLLVVGAIEDDKERAADNAHCARRHFTARPAALQHGLCKLAWHPPL